MTHSQLLRVRVRGDAVRKWGGALSCALIIAAAFALLGQHLRGGWRFDDPLILQFAQRLPDFHSAFLRPETWRQLGVPFFTPMLTAVFQFNHVLFGVSSTGFYAHHLLVLLVAALLTYDLVSAATHRLGGLCAALLFLAGAPTTVVASQLMTIHYVWGLVWALLSLACWRRFLKTHRGWDALASAGLYLLAALCKEIYAPLPLVLAAMALGQRPSQWLAMVWHALAALVFVVWRSFMIGDTVGGYGSSFNAAANVWQTLRLLPTIFWGPGGSLVLMGGAVGVAACCRLVLQKHAFGVAIASALAVVLCALAALLLPFAFVAASPDPVHWRLAFLPWWALSVGLGMSLGCVMRSLSCQTTGYGWVWALLAGVVVIAAGGLALVQHQRVERQLNATLRVYDAHSRHALSARLASWVLLQGYPAMDMNYQYGLYRIAQHQGLPVTRVEAFAQRARWAANEGLGYAYNHACDCMAEIEATRDVEPMQPQGLIRLQFEQPMTHGMRWQLGASGGDGDWFLHIPGLAMTAQIPPQGAVGYAMAPWLQAQPFQVVWRHPDGHWAQTPAQAFPARGQQVRF